MVHTGFNPSSLHQMCCKGSHQLCLHSKSAQNLSVSVVFRTCQLGLSLYNLIEVKQKSWFGLFHPRQFCLYKGGEEGGEHIKLYLKCSVSDTFQATSVVVSMVFYWSECYVKASKWGAVIVSPVMMCWKNSVSGMRVSLAVPAQNKCL